MTQVVAKRAQSEFPTNPTDGTIYVKQGGTSGTTAPEYSLRIGAGASDTKLQLDKDKIYTVEGTQLYVTGDLPCPGTLRGSIPGLTDYFAGLKILFCLNGMGFGDINSVSVQLKSTTDQSYTLLQKTVYIENQGKTLSGGILPMGLGSAGTVMMEYRDDIPTEDPGVSTSGFVVVGNLYDPRNGNEFLRLDGSSQMTGILKVGNHRVSGVSDPQYNTDGVNKKYVDDIRDTLVSQIESPVNSVSYPDTYLSNIDGTKQVSYAYYTTETTGGTTRISGNVLGFQYPMEANSCIHIFAYSSASAKNGEIPVPYTYDSGTGYIDIPIRLCGRLDGNGTPNARDYTFINGEGTYIGVNGLVPNNSNNQPQQASQPHIDSNSVRRFRIPEFGMIEISVFYNEFKKDPNSNDVYSRTVIKCDAEEIPVA